jgi:hypothetical protein
MKKLAEPIVNGVWFQVVFRLLVVTWIAGSTVWMWQMQQELSALNERAIARTIAALEARVEGLQSGLYSDTDAAVESSKIVTEVQASRALAEERWSRLMDRLDVIEGLLRER